MCLYANELCILGTEETVCNFNRFFPLSKPPQVGIFTIRYCPTIINVRRFFFLFEFTSPRTYDPGFRFFVKQSSKQEGKKNVPSSFFLQK